MPDKILTKTLRCLIAPANADDTETSTILRKSRNQLPLTINKHWYTLSKVAQKQKYKLARKSTYNNLAIAIEEHVDATKDWEKAKFEKITPEAFTNVVKTRDLMEELASRLDRFQQLGEDFNGDI